MIIRREGLLECPDDGRRSVGSHTTTALTAPHRSASIQTLFLFRFLDSSYSSKLNLCVYKEILKGHLPKAVFQSILESELERWRVRLHQLFTGYIALSYIARFMWLLAKSYIARNIWSYSQVHLAIQLLAIQPDISCYIAELYSQKYMAIYATQFFKFLAEYIARYFWLYLAIQLSVIQPNISGYIVALHSQ